MRTGHYGNNQDVFITCRIRTRGADRQVFRGLRTRRYGAVSAAPAALPGGTATGPGLHGDTCLHGMYLPPRAAITCACHTCLHGPYLHMSHLLAHATPACTGCTCLPRAIPLPPHTTPSCTCHACLHGPRLPASGYERSASHDASLRPAKSNSVRFDQLFAWPTDHDVLAGIQAGSHQ